MHSRRDLLKAASLLALPTSFVSAAAQSQDTWPSHEIHVIAGLPAGSGGDIFTRFYAKKLEQVAGKPVIVENRPGAFGYIAAQYVQKSKPDGYTIFIGAGSFLAAGPSLFKKAPFDPVRDFEHVTTLSKNPFILVVSAESPFKTAADLTDYLKQQGDKASYGSVAVTGLVASELYKAQFGLQTVEVKYKDSASAINDLLGKHISFMHLEPGVSTANIRSGRLRALATTTADRLKALPEIPGAREAGIVNSDLTSWWSVHTPTKTPKSVVKRLEGWFNEIAVAEDTIKFLNNLGNDPLPGNSEMLETLMISEVKTWSEYIKIAKIEPLS